MERSKTQRKLNAKWKCLFCMRSPTLIFQNFCSCFVHVFGGFVPLMAEKTNLVNDKCEVVEHLFVLRRRRLHKDCLNRLTFPDKRRKKVQKLTVDLSHHPCLKHVPERKTQTLTSCFRFKSVFSGKQLFSELNAGISTFLITKDTFKLVDLIHNINISVPVTSHSHYMYMRWLIWGDEKGRCCCYSWWRQLQSQRPLMKAVLIRDHSVSTFVIVKPLDFFMICLKKFVATKTGSTAE